MISEITRGMRFVFWIVASVLAVAGIAPCTAALPVIGPEDGFNGFLRARNADAEVTKDAITLQKIEENPGLVFSCRPFFASEANAFEARYRAVGTGSLSGQLYYAPSGKEYSDGSRWITPPLVADGRWHVLRVGLESCDNPADWRNAGILDNFRWDPTDSPGGRLEVASVRFLNVSDPSIKTKKNPDKEDCAEFDEDVWPPVESEIWQSPGNIGPNGSDTAVAVKSLGGTAEPRRATAGATVRLRYDFAGPCLKDGTTINAMLRCLCGDSVRWEEKVKFSSESIKRMSDRVWRLEFDYKLPLCLDSCEMKIRILSPSIKCVSGHLPDAPLSFERVKCIPGWEQTTSSSVQMVAGTPYFSVNGNVSPSLWGAVTRGGRIDGTYRHSSAPLDLVTVWSDTSKIWPRDGVFDPADFDRRAEAHLRAHPNAYFIWSLELYVPPDWALKHPEDMAQIETGEINQDSSPRCRPNYSFASDRVARAMEEILVRMIGYLEQSPYANRIVGYRLASGRTIEWLSWTPMKDNTVLDFSPSARKGFEAFAKKYYPEIKDRTIPTFAERQQTANGELLWDGQKHLRVAAFNDFHSTTIADMVSRLCRCAKNLLGGRKVVGTYYGYTMTLNGGGAGQMRGHYALKRLLDSGTVDFLASPQEYSQIARGPGSTCIDMKPFRTLQNHGIVSAVEDDTRTHNNPPVNYVQLPNEALSVGVLRRNMGIALCRNQPFYTLALKSGCEFDFPAFAHDSESWRAAKEYAIGVKAKRNAEIAVVVSEEAIKSTPMIHSVDSFDMGVQQYDVNGAVERRLPLNAASVTGWSSGLAYRELARIGAPVDYLLAEDLLDNPGDYRLYVFQCCTMLTPALKAAAESLRQRNCTILWTYAPGYVSREGNSVANMKALTGVDFVKCKGAFDPAVILADGRRIGSTESLIAPLFAVKNPERILGTYRDGSAGFASVKTGPSTTVFSGTYRMEAPVLRNIARDAGIHLYSDSLDPVEANERFFTLHARHAGSKTVRLPKKVDVVDVFNRRLVARGVDEFTFDAPLHSSWLFCFADDAVTLLEKLK